jgi:hypothetical protein
MRALSVASFSFGQDCGVDCWEAKTAVASDLDNGWRSNSDDMTMVTMVEDAERIFMKMLAASFGLVSC